MPTLSQNGPTHFSFVLLRQVPSNLFQIFHNNNLGRYVCRICCPTSTRLDACSACLQTRSDNLVVVSWSLIEILLRNMCLPFCFATRVCLCVCLCRCLCLSTCLSLCLAVSPIACPCLVEILPRNVCLSDMLVSSRLPEQPDSREVCHALASSPAKSETLRENRYENRSRKGPGAPKIDPKAVPAPCGA